MKNKDYEYACRLAKSMRGKFKYNPDNWEVLDDLHGVLSQIDNMLSVFQVIPEWLTDTTVTRTVIEFKKGERVTTDSLKKYRTCGIELSDYYKEEYEKSKYYVSCATLTKDVTITIQIEVK